MRVGPCYVIAKRSLRLLELVVGLVVSGAAFLPLRIVLMESEVLYPRASVVTDVAMLRSNRRFDDLALAMRFCMPSARTRRQLCDGPSGTTDNNAAVVLNPTIRCGPPTRRRAESHAPHP